MSSQRTPTTFPKNLLANQVALVTGGSRGIGKATALRLAEAGAHVVINFVSDERAAEALVQQVRALGVDSFAVRADVAQPSEAEILISTTLKQFGRCDLLIANAGIWEGAPIEEMAEAQWDRVLATNLKGTWTCCRAVVPVMKNQGRGAIVIVSSTAGQRGEAGYSNYAAAKGGQISLTKSLATELAPSIRVNCVAPGWVDTQLNELVFNDERFKRKVIEGIPLERVASADDVALSIVFLSSDWARHITGEVLNVNGGSVLCG